jgi:hypothetical protein
MRDQNPKRYPPHQEPPPPSHGDSKCKENDTPTQKWINAERKKFCLELDAAAGAVYQWEENYSGWTDLQQSKKCLFIWTEKNYEIFRNLQITTGLSLNLFNESIKENTTTFLKANKTLSDGLKEVLKKVKESLAKAAELRTAASDLRHCTEEACNCTQWGILTGDWPHDCKGPRPEIKRPPECDNIKDKFDKLFCIPDALSKDMKSIWKASADVVGIQIFSNISSLETLQKSLSESAVKFDKHLVETVKKDQEDLKKMQEEFVKTATEFSKSKSIVYTRRSEFEGLFETAGFFCCPDCGCVEKDHICEERLARCKEEICKICEEVNETFCEDEEPSTPVPHQHAY